MENEKVINLLNERTKKVIDDMLSFIDFLDSIDEDTLVTTKENGELSYNKLNESTIFIYSFFLSSLKNDKIINKFFDNYDVNFNSLVENFSVEGERMEQFLDKFMQYKEATNTKSFNKVNLKLLFDSILIKLKYTTYLENEAIDYSRIEPYHLFDYFIDEYPHYFEGLLNTHIDFNSTIMEKLVNYLHKNYSEFAATYDIDVDQKAEDEINNITRYSFKDCEIFEKDGEYFIIFKKSANLNSIIPSKKDIYDLETFDNALKDYADKLEYIQSLELPVTFQIITIDGRKPTKTMANALSKVTKKNLYDFKLKNISDSTILTCSIDKYKAFINFENSESFDRHSKFLTDMRKETSYRNMDDTNLYCPNLQKYGFDLTEDKYIKDPSIGRENEIRKLEQILSYPERDKSIIITGTAGSGKTALVKGLAYRIQKGDVPNHLKNLKIISIDVSTLVAGTKYVGTLEEKMKAILDEASMSKNIIIFIDEIHQALGAGVSEKDNNSVSEILKPYLDYGRVRVIGATTTEEYMEYLDTDQAFKTRFKRVVLSEPDEAIIYQILDDLIENYNNLSNKTDFYCPKLILDETEKDKVIKWLINVTDKKYRDYRDKSSNPRLVLDIIKEAYAIAAMRDSDVVTLTDIAEALNCEERLYKNYKERAIPELLAIKPEDKKDNIIQFSLIKK